MLAPNEAMDILGVGRNTMYRLLNSGQLPAVRIGRMWRIQLTSLNSIFSAQNSRYREGEVFSLIASGLCT